MASQEEIQKAVAMFQSELDQSSSNLARVLETGTLIKISPNWVQLHMDDNSQSLNVTRLNDGSVTLDLLVPHWQEDTAYITNLPQFAQGLRELADHVEAWSRKA